LACIIARGGDDIGELCVFFLVGFGPWLCPMGLCLERVTGSGVGVSGVCCGVCVMACEQWIGCWQMLRGS